MVAEQTERHWIGRFARHWIGRFAGMLVIAAFVWPIGAVAVIFLMVETGSNGVWAGLRPNEWGDVFAGVAGPSALFVLAASFLLQKDELRLQREEMSQTRKTLNEQKDQMAISARQLASQNDIIKQQSEMAQDRFLVDDWKFTLEKIKPAIRLIASEGKTDELYDYDISTLLLLENLDNENNMYWGSNRILDQLTPLPPKRKDRMILVRDTISSFLGKYEEDRLEIVLSGSIEIEIFRRLDKLEILRKRPLSSV